MTTQQGGAAQYGLLAGLTEAEAAQVLGLGKRSAIAAGQPLVSLGGEADAIYLVASGLVRLMVPLNVQGKTEDVFMEEQGRGEAVGWSALVAPYRFTLNARAAIDSEVIRLERKDLEALFERERSIGFKVMTNLATMVGQRLHKVQAMWVRSIQQAVDARLGAGQG